MQNDAAIKSRIDLIRKSAHDRAEMEDWYEAAGIEQSVMHDVAGGAHPLTRALEEAVKSADWQKLLGAIKSVIALYDSDALPSPRLRIAGEIEGDFRHCRSTISSC